MNKPTTAHAPRPHQEPRPDVWEIQRRIRRSTLSFAGKVLLAAILDRDRYGQSRNGCTASLETLAEDIGATRRYVVKILPELIKSGWIVALKRDGNIRPLKMGTMVPYQSPSREPECNPPGNDRVSNQGTIVPSKVLEERKEEYADPARPPDGRPVSAPVDDAPRLDDGREIPPGFQVHGARTAFELFGLDPARQAHFEAELIREGKLRRRKPAG